ncbi:MAG: hypothetical protein QG665_178 [Patescibacteria group bacterium]|nr:hypothetical protein [Patescibacteria group bacterium]
MKRFFAFFVIFGILVAQAGAQTGGPRRERVNNNAPSSAQVQEVAELEVEPLAPPQPAQTPVPVVVAGSVEKTKSATETAQSYGYGPVSGPAPRQTQPQGPPPARYISERGAMKRQYDRPQEVVDGQELQVETSRADDDYRWFQEENRHQERMSETAIRAERDRLRHQEQVLNTYSNFGREILRQQNYRQGGSSSARSYQRLEGQVQRLPGGEIVGIIGGFLQR